MPAHHAEARAVPLGAFVSAVAERLAGCGDPAGAPVQLADLFRWSFRPSPRSAAMTQALQASLLRWTLHKACTNTRFYDRGLYRECAAREHAVEPDLRGLPVLGRRDVIEHLDDMQSDAVSFGALCHTSGCTGAPLSVYKSEQELAFIWRYQSRLQEPVQQQLRLRPLVLSMPNLYHGTAVRVPSIGKVFVAGVTDDLLLADVVPLLRQRFRIDGHEERISIITCLVHQILFLTHYLLEHGVDPREFDVRSINVVGGYVTSRARAFLKSSWDAMIFDRFSLTESAGGAVRCPACGNFHLDPHVVGEVLDADGDDAVDEGVGRLVLTDLYPFVQMQPLVRYDTGDLVRRVHSDCQSTLSFEFAGKASNCIRWRPHGKTEWLLLSVPLHEVLDPLPDLRRVEQFRSVHSTRDASVGSLPVYTLGATEPAPGRLDIRLALELRYSPHFFPERVQALTQIVWDGVAAAHPRLASRVAEGTVRFHAEFTGPGGLEGAGVLKV